MASASTEEAPKVVALSALKDLVLVLREGDPRPSISVWRWSSESKERKSESISTTSVFSGEKDGACLLSDDKRIFVVHAEDAKHKPDSSKFEMRVQGPIARVDGTGQCIAWTNTSGLVLFPSRVPVRLAHPRTFKDGDCVDRLNYTVCPRSYDYRGGCLVVVWQRETNPAFLAVYKCQTELDAEWPMQWHVELNYADYVKSFKKVVLTRSGSILVLTGGFIEEITTSSKERTDLERTVTCLASVGDKILMIQKTDGGSHDLVVLGEVEPRVQNVHPDWLVRASDSVVYYVCSGNDVHRLDFSDA